MTATQLVLNLLGVAAVAGLSWGALALWEVVARFRGLAVREQAATAEVQRLSGELAISRVQLETERRLWREAVSSVSGVGR